MRCWRHPGLWGGRAPTHPTRRTNKAPALPARAPSRPILRADIRSDTSGRDSPPKPHPGRRKPSTSEKDAIRIALDVATQGWQRTVAHRLADTLGDGLWAKFRRRWYSGTCRALANSARELLKIRTTVHQTVGNLAAETWGLLALPRIGREVVRELASKVALPGEGGLVGAARALQVLGVYICVQMGRDLSRCLCLKDLRENMLREMLEDTIRHTLIQIKPEKDSR